MSHYHFKTTLKEIRVRNPNRVIIAHININSIRNKIEFLSEGVIGHIDILMASETKIDDSFSTSQFVISGFSTPFRLDRNAKGGGILVYIREYIPAKLLKILSVSEQTECACQLNLTYVRQNGFLCAHITLKKVIFRSIYIV